MKFPHKIIKVHKEKCDLFGCDILILSDMGNHRVLVINEETYECVEVIGWGKSGYLDGSFESSKFNQTFGIAYLDNKIYIWDGKNHRIRVADLISREVSTIAGTGTRGEDPKASNKNMLEQNLTTPFDIIYDSDDKLFYIAMSGIHQIWTMDLNKNVILPFSGSGVEGCRDHQEDLLQWTWAQPSGISIGIGKEGVKELYVADSESSKVRAINLDTLKSARTVVGGDGTPTNLFSYGDKDGIGTDAKLQHLVGLHYVDKLNTLFVADSYNHKVKLVNTQSDEISTIFGTGHSSLKDGGGLVWEF